MVSRASSCLVYSPRSGGSRGDKRDHSHVIKQSSLICVSIHLFLLRYYPSPLPLHYDHNGLVSLGTSTNDKRHRQGSLGRETGSPPEREERWKVRLLFPPVSIADTPHLPRPAANAKNSASATATSPSKTESPTNPAASSNPNA